MVEKNCSEATTNSGETLGSRNGRYPGGRERGHTIETLSSPRPQITPNLLQTLSSPTLPSPSYSGGVFPRKLGSHSYIAMLCGSQRAQRSKAWDSWAKRSWRSPERNPTKEWAPQNQRVEEG